MMFQVGVEAEVSRPVRVLRADPGRVVGRDAARIRVEAELENGVGAGAGGDVGHVAVAVGGVGLEAVGARARFQPLHRRPGHRAVAADGVNRGVSGVVVGGQQVVAGPVGGHVTGVRLQPRRADQFQVAAAGVQPEAGDLQVVPTAHVNKPPVRAGGHGRRPPRGLRFSEEFQAAVGGVQGEAQQLAFAGNGNVGVESHCFTSVSRF